MGNLSEPEADRPTKKYYVTFGQSHAHAIGGRTYDRDCVAVIEAADYETARETAFACFEAKFSHLLTEEPPMHYYPRGLIAL